MEAFLSLIKKSIKKGYWPVQVIFLVVSDLPKPKWMKDTERSRPMAVNVYLDTTDHNANGVPASIT